MGADPIDDLEAECAALDAVLAGLDDAAWDTPTPAVPFTVRDQVFHLGFSEELAGHALLDPGTFPERLVELLGELDDLERTSAARARAMAPDQLLGYWRSGRQATLGGLRAKPTGERVPWIVGDMSVASFATARLMETWAHGQDVLDGLGLRREATPRLLHVAELGVRTRGFAYRNRGRDVPAGDVRVELDAPGGGTWAWGDPGAADRVTGSAEDFCLVVTQRRRVEDTDLSVSGPLATEWMAIAQAFAGPPTETRARA
jgi:uncharacterized protein (TIGR03084 family)